ncbi:hypothetical protein [Stomatohabitans albus]|uniref:hypothetical protein n=1 Tax=Stomatohabitans albus TaxID=3110766 RepID=UPI00300D4B05
MKRLLFPFLTGIGVWFALLALWVGGLAIWNSTLNTADRTWSFADKELTSAQMRQLSLELEQDSDRELYALCLNPKSNKHGLSGRLQDRSRGSTVNAAPDYADYTDVPAVSSWESFADELACHAVFPHHSFDEFIYLTVFSPIASLVMWMLFMMTG